MIPEAGLQTRCFVEGGTSPQGEYGNVTIGGVSQLLESFKYGILISIRIDFRNNILHGAQNDRIHQQSQ